MDWFCATRDRSFQPKYRLVESGSRRKSAAHNWRHSACDSLYQTLVHVNKWSTQRFLQSTDSTGNFLRPSSDSSEHDKTEHEDQGLRELSE